MTTDETHFSTVANALANGNVVPFLGAGVNFRKAPSEGGALAALPNGPELARLIAGPGAPLSEELLKTSQYVALLEGSGPLYQRLRRVFAAEYQPAPVHDFLINLSSLLSARGFTPPCPLIVTTNYDHVLEAAFQRSGTEFEQLVFVAEGKSSGKFLHWKWRQPATTKAGTSPTIDSPSIDSLVVRGHRPSVIDVPNIYQDTDLTDGRRPVILKLHGAVDMISATFDSYVITEDDYIEYLANPEMQNFLPVSVHERLMNSHILFMGYALRDWNLRVILRRIWDARMLTWTSWAVQLPPDDALSRDLDRRLWQKHDVEILYRQLDDYVAELRAAIAVLSHKP